MSMYDEIKEIPEAARRCYEANRHLSLPQDVPYLGMGSSYFAPLALYYLGVPVRPFIASEYYYYLSGGKKEKRGVLISQSGESSETVWCSNLFDTYTAIVNDPASTLARKEIVEETVLLRAGKEEYSATKSYLNTLIALYLGHGLDVLPAVNVLQEEMNKFEQQALSMAEAMYSFTENKTYKAAYILGNGPNIATAYEAALILSETTKLPFIGMPLAQFDHGPKETANESIVIAIVTKEKLRKRTEALLKTVGNAGALTLAVEEQGLPEHLSPITTIVPLNFLAFFLAQKRGISSTFEVGNKVTRVKEK